MKRILSCLAIFFFFCLPVFSQQVTYSDLLKDDSRNMDFEILGNFNGNYLIYKHKQRNYRLSVYDKNMVVTKEVKLDFISDKTFNVDFITYPDYFYIIYQYQKGNHIYCNAAKMDALGNIVGNEFALDTTKISFWADNKIYYTAGSEDKSKILLYRMVRKNDTFTLSTFLFDSNMQKIDSTSEAFDYNDRKESFGDLEVGNDGTYYYTKETSKNRSDYTSKLELFYRTPHTAFTNSKLISLDDRYVQDVNVKIDNLNKLVFLNAYSYKRTGGSVEGLFTVVMGKDSLNETQRAYNIFDDSLRNKLTDRGDWRTAFDNFYLRNIVLKKDSGILVTMEDYYTQSRGFSNRFNRPGYGYYDPYSFSSSNYYRFQRSYYDPYYYRGDYLRNNDRDLVYNYSDLLIFNFTKDLKMKWSNIINKKQNDIESDVFLSYSTINMGSEIHYLFIDKNKQVINDFALQPNGEIRRYATIKSGEVGYTFMPKLLKQVSARQVIVPCLFRNSIGFARIDFSNIQ